MERLALPLPHPVREQVRAHRWEEGARRLVEAEGAVHGSVPTTRTTHTPTTRTTSTDRSCSRLPRQHRRRREVGAGAAQGARGWSAGVERRLIPATPTSRGESRSRISPTATWEGSNLACRKLARNSTGSENETKDNRKQRRNDYQYRNKPTVLIYPFSTAFRHNYFFLIKKEEFFFQFFIVIVLNCLCIVKYKKTSRPKVST